MKIGQYLAKIWTRVQCLLFLTHGVLYIYYLYFTCGNVCDCIAFLLKYMSVRSFFSSICLHFGP